jgi:predicted  nucleic acid-binding Zn-ribbon protein
MPAQTRESMKFDDNKRILDAYEQEFQKNRVEIEKLEQVIANRCSDSADPESQTNAQLEALVADFQAESARLDTEIASLGRDIAILQEGPPQPKQGSRPPSRSRTAARSGFRPHRK